MESNSLSNREEYEDGPSIGDRASLAGEEELMVATFDKCSELRGGEDGDRETSDSDMPNSDILRRGFVGITTRGKNDGDGCASKLDDANVREGPIKGVAEEDDMEFEGANEASSFD